MLFLSLIFLQLAVFAVLVFFLRVVFRRNVSAATAHLHELNQDYTHKLDDARKKQAEAEKYFDDTILRAKSEAEKSRMQILKETREQQEAVLGQARQQSEDILKQANKAGEAILKEIDERVEARAIERAVDLVQTLLPGQMSRQMHDRWLEDLLKNGMDQLDRLNLPADLKEAQVASAYDLSSEQKASLQKKIKDAAKRELKLVFSADPHLVAGIKLTFGSVIVDGSLQLKIREHARHANHTARA